MKPENCSHIEMQGPGELPGDRKWISVRSCENCSNAIRQGDTCEAVYFGYGPPLDQLDIQAFLNQIECLKGIQRFQNGQEIVEANPGRDRYKAMAKYCKDWEDRREPLPPFSGKGPSIYDL